MKLLVIGGNPAGMSAASRVKRRDPSWEVTVLEATREVSYGACGLPYYVSGLNNDLDLIRLRKAPEFEAQGIRVRLGCRVTKVDLAQKTVYAYDEQGQELVEQYDKLMIASGSSPKRPPIPGIEQKNIFVLKTLDHAQKLREALEKSRGHVVIIGGGAIGLEIAESCLLQKAASVRVIEALDQVMNGFDEEFAGEMLEELRRQGVAVDLSERVQSFEGTDGSVSAVVTDKGRYPADLVVLSIGVSPNTQFVDGIEKLGNGAIVTDTAMRTSVADVYAAGDCASVWHKLLQKPMYIALGTNANKQGRLAGDSILGRPACFDRALGTSMLRFMNLEVARTGLTEREAAAAGMQVKTCTVTTRSHARYYPDPAELTVKLCYRADDHVLLGAQVMGRKEAAIRIDVFAVAVDQGMTTEELGFVDLGYAPPFAAVWDAVQVAANASK